MQQDGFIQRNSKVYGRLPSNDYSCVPIDAFAIFSHLNVSSDSPCILTRMLLFSGLNIHVLHASLQT